MPPLTLHNAVKESLVVRYQRRHRMRQGEAVRRAGTVLRDFEGTAKRVRRKAPTPQFPNCAQIQKQRWEDNGKGCHLCPYKAKHPTLGVGLLYRKCHLTLTGKTPEGPVKKWPTYPLSFHPEFGKKE